MLYYATNIDSIPLNAQEKKLAETLTYFDKYIKSTSCSERPYNVLNDYFVASSQCVFIYSDTSIYQDDKDERLSFTGLLPLVIYDANQ